MRGMAELNRAELITLTTIPDLELFLLLAEKREDNIGRCFACHTNQTIQGLLEDFIEWSLLMSNDLLLKQNAQIEFFSKVNDFIIAITSTIAVTIVLYKMIEVMSKNAAVDAIP